MCGQHAVVYLFPFPALYHLVTFQSHDLPFHFQAGSCLYLSSVLCQCFSLSIFLFSEFFSKKPKNKSVQEYQSVFKIPNSSLLSPHIRRCPVVSQGQAKLQYACNIVHKSHSFVQCVTLTSREAECFEVMIFSVHYDPSEEGTQHHLVNSLQRQHTHTNTRLHNPSLRALNVFVFACVKLQLYRCPASKAMLTDRHAKRTAKHLCSPQRFFLSYNWLSCPTCGFGYKNRLFQQEPPSSPRGTQRTMEGAFGDERQSGFLFQRAVDVHGSRIRVLAMR